mgnify:CR=1 FL=1
MLVNPYVIQEPQQYKGHVAVQIFGNNNPIFIEVGMGKGQFITSLAALHPEINYIGIEKYSSVLIRAIEKQEDLQLPNLKFLRFDAEYLPDIFAPGEIAHIYLNFSDPWPKDRHAKRRLTSEGFLNLYHTILNPDGYIQFKTDNRDLFDFSVETAENSPIWNIKELTYDLHHSEFLQGNIMTEYESKFVAEGKPICRFVLSR